MTEFLRHSQATGVVKLSGTIVSYRSTQESANFVYSQSEQHAMGVVAIAAAVAGMGGQAASVVGYASDLEELAEYVEFDLNDAPIKGWVWRSPFKEGDVVDVAAEWQGDHYEVYGIARPADKTIALYPHCSRAKRRHIKNAIKWWLLWNLVFFGFTGVAMLSIAGLEIFLEPEVYWIAGPVALFWILMFVSLARQFMPFVRLSDKVFRVLRLPDAANIDLVKSSKKQRTEQDAPEFGTFYFRY
jgi:hypothetical protein